MRLGCEFWRTNVPRTTRPSQKYPGWSGVLFCAKAAVAAEWSQQFGRGFAEPGLQELPRALIEEASRAYRALARHPVPRVSHGPLPVKRPRGDYIIVTPLSWEHQLSDSPEQRQFYGQVLGRPPA